MEKKEKTELSTSSYLSYKKRRLERILIGMAVLFILGLTVIETYVVSLGAGVPTTHSLLILVLINVNIVLLFLLLVLILRNLYKIFFEQGHVTGARLRTKLVVAFVSLSLVPTILLFYAGLQFITTGHDYWFDENVERSLVDSLVLAQFLSDVNERFTHDFGENIKDEILRQKLFRPGQEKKLEKYLREKRRDYHLSMVQVYSPVRDEPMTILAPEFDLGEETAPALPDHLFVEAEAQRRPRSWVDVADRGDLVRVVWPIVADGQVLVGFLVVGYQSPAPLKEKMKAVEAGLAGYRELKRLHDPIRVSHYIALTIVALLSIFVSTYIGFHLAKGITGPIMELAQATKRIANGDYDFSIDVLARDDEIATLVDSFNHMTRDLKAGEEALTQKNLQLQMSNQELEQRRRYIEIILQSVAAGVISVNAEGAITTFNNSAEETLNIKADKVLGRPLREVMAPDQQLILDRLLRTAQLSPKGAADRQVKLEINDQNLSLHIHLTLLKDEGGRFLGMVIVFDDLSEVAKVQRMAAWREVARRIAHEIKNPLTPIQLSTQRLRRRYAHLLDDESRLFDECTMMIIRQVDELKRLVGEFSNFARMPEASPTPNDLGRIVDETLIMYYDSHRQLEFVFNKDPNLPAFLLDREQMTRVLINLLDNAVAAVDDDGRIEITLSYNPLLKMARLEVADNGVGISPQNKERLFEPYYSTKKSGTGLGLAIVSTTVADHDGFVRVQDNHPRGTRFIIELPVRT